MKPTERIELIKALAVTAQLMGTTLSEEAAEVFAGDLSGFPVDAIKAALVRCRKEVKGRLTVADVVSRIDDGRPGPEEAWAMLPKNEHDSVVWSDEMRRAFGVCGPLLSEGDHIAARMAFREAYISEVQKARDAGTPVTWTPSYGHDRIGRASAVREAIDRGRLAHGCGLLEQLEATDGPRSGQQGIAGLLDHVIGESSQGRSMLQALRAKLRA